ncbi:acyl carrier protein [Kibdelosporangium aridum]|uniref:Phosphopantetheine attachment site n=1 Tax=Kibdelosporangium aridum TaxID=2030 RepID=A0A1W2E8R5_KIBAR|nr:phosphopantetheine-binding protein [Kibdelosporangium aridum]SMD05927.1 Phosphopantetheine attachment site [Kibdelosporangium aridum]
MTEQSTMDKITELWLSVLDIPSVSVDENFFDVGGDSILLIILLDRLQTMTDRELEPPDLFRHTTIRAQADLLAGVTKAQPARAPGRGSVLGSRRSREA